MKERPRIRYWLPGAAVCESDLLDEIQELYERGFGGIEIVVLERLTETIAKSEYGWGTKQWNRIIKIIGDETKKHGMQFDLANGPGWPISSPVLNNADEKGTIVELTYGVSDVQSGKVYQGLLPERRCIHTEGTAELICAIAYIETEKNILCEKSFLNLTDYVKNGVLSYKFPEISEGKWKLFAFYSQPALQKTSADRYYVIDHLSKEGTDACAAYWNKFFTEYSCESMESIFCDSLEYEVTMDWSRNFLEEFEKRRGYSLIPYLPVIGTETTYPTCDIPGFRFENKAKSEAVNYDYMEVLTQCYIEFHLQRLEEMAQKYGKTIRYQVAYNKMLDVERCAMIPAIPENEALGRPSIDYQKTMASAVHFCRKERYSFECAAEFGNSYGQDFEDLFWWIKRSYMAGMNAQVLHGGSYSGAFWGEGNENGKIPGEYWPGYAGFGMMVSNNWNRTLSKEDCRGCMDTIARMNHIFGLDAKIDCAIFRYSYGDLGTGSEFCLYPDDGAMVNRGYSYEFLTEALLMELLKREQDGVLDKDGASYRCLIIPETEKISLNMLLIIEKLTEKKFPVLYIGKLPGLPVFFSEVNTEEKYNIWKEHLIKLHICKELIRVKNIYDVPDILGEHKILPRIRLDGEKDMMTAMRVSDGGEEKYIALYAYNRVEYSPDEPNPEEAACSAIYRKGTTKGSYCRPGMKSRKWVRVQIEGQYEIVRYDPWNDKRRKENVWYHPLEGYSQIEVEIEEDEMILFQLCSSVNEKMYYPYRSEEYPVYFTELRMESFEPDTEEEYSFLRSSFYDTGMKIRAEKWKPWRLMDKQLENFSGRGFYTGNVFLPEKQETNCQYVLELGNVCDTFRVKINGKETEFPDQVMKRVDVTEMLHSGNNQIEVMVSSNLYNRVFAEKRPVQRISSVWLPRNYGMWESEEKQIKLYKMT